MLTYHICTRWPPTIVTKYGVHHQVGKLQIFFIKFAFVSVFQIHTSLVNGRPGANESSAALREFTLARYVRLRLQKIRTLNAEYMCLRPGFDDASVTRRLFYSIKDISIGGQCVCSGHANRCPQNGKYGVCSIVIISTFTVLLYKLYRIHIR